MQHDLTPKDLNITGLQGRIGESTYVQIYNPIPTFPPVFQRYFPPSFNGIFLHGWPAMDIPVKLSAGGSISPDLGGQHRANWGAMLRDHKLWLVYIF